MIRQAFILMRGVGADQAALQRLTAEVRRHGVEAIRVVEQAVRPEMTEDRAFLLDSAGWLDINLWDLALAAGDGSALAVSTDGACGGVAVVDGAVLQRLGGLDADLFERLSAAPDLPRRGYDRPRLNPAADIVRGAVIFDRDGVLNLDTEYPYRPDQIVWTPTAKAAVKAVNDAGLYAFVATNQSGVARGFYGEQDVIDLHGWMNGELIAAGAHIDAFDYSPFHPEGTVEAFRRESDCRKPGPRMLNRLIEAHAVDRSRTVMVGDRPGDVAAGVAAGVDGLLFEGGDLTAFLAPVIARLAR
jgi:D-glycero-D-manno-heptose 1,7-bisphosphate phosphatase